VAGSDEDLKKQIDELKAQLDAEKAKGKKGVYLKVSNKGGASLYGIRRFPITFYLEEWTRILDMEDEIRRFLSEHEAELSKKG
jgi:hypothetical protein